MDFNEKYKFPRPDFIRENMQLLDGEWDFDFDDDEKYANSLKRGNELQLSQKIIVPFPFQSPLSGINCQRIHEHVAYQKQFSINKSELGKSTILHFGAVDYETNVFINGKYIGTHIGGYTPFEFEISDYLSEGNNVLSVSITDKASREQCRGKQIWGEEPKGCFYVAVTGIWQSVWIEHTGKKYITNVKFDNNFDERIAKSIVDFSQPVCGNLTAILKNDGRELSRVTSTVSGTKCVITFNFEDIGLDDSKEINWSVAHPINFDVDFILECEDSVDNVSTYFGFRKIHVSGNKIYFNNSQIFIKAVLDQGYWKEGIYRPKDDDEFRKDIELTKELGFNCARKHQKIEDPKYYYWADRLGLLVWGELPSFFSFTEKSQSDALSTMTEFIKRDFNHPSIIMWVPFNETWGLRRIVGLEKEQNFARSMYYYIKSLDSTRLVSTNDGWENINPTDIISVHDYREFDDKLVEYYSNTEFLESGSARTGHPYLIPGEKYQGQPILITEMGGKRLETDAGWGYNEAEKSREKLKDAIESVIENVMRIKNISGYCYTQLTDVYQETNGYADMDRQLKF